MERLRGAALSPQQAKCLALVGEGLTTKEIAFKLGLAETTVDEHIKKATVKLGAPNRARAAALHRAHAETVAISPGASAGRAGTQYPEPIRGEIFTVHPIPVFEAASRTTLLVSDGEHPPFEGLPPGPLQPRQTEQSEPAFAFQNHLKIIGLVLAIAVAIVLLLVAAPALIEGAENIARWLRLMRHRQP